MMSTMTRIELTKRKFRDAMNTLDGEIDQRLAVDSWILDNLYSPFEVSGFKIQMEVVRRGNVEDLMAVRFFGGPLGSVMSEMTVHFAMVGMIFELEARRRRKFSSGHNPLLHPTTLIPTPMPSSSPATPTTNIFDPTYTVTTMTTNMTDVISAHEHVPIIMVHTPSLTCQPLSRAGSGCGMKTRVTKKRLERVSVAAVTDEWVQGVSAR